MARYIDVERLKRTFASGIRVYDGMCKIADVMHNIENEPTADVVEVVRCEECTRKVDYEGMIMCNVFGHKFQGEWYGLRATTKDHFCSYGERK